MDQPTLTRVSAILVKIAESDVSDGFLTFPLILIILSDLPKFYISPYVYIYIYTCVFVLVCVRARAKGLHFNLALPRYDRKPAKSDGIVISGW